MNTSTTTPLPKLIRLEQAIKIEADPVKRGCLRAERAGLLARQGSFDLAREALNALQHEFGRNPQASVSTWMQIAEGWMAHYNGDLSLSKDHLQRAYALSGAINDKSLQALSAAWLAHLAYAQDKFTEMARYLDICKTLVQDDENLTQSRLSLVFAQAFHFANRFDLAQPWYLKSRTHALIDKDDAALSVLSYNWAGRRAFHFVADSINTSSTSQDRGLTEIGIQSSYNFDQLFRIQLLGSWVHMVQAMAASAEAKFTEALKLYERHFAEAMKTRFSDQIAFFKADMAWCYGNTGAIQKATNHIHDSMLLLNEKMYVEDQLITFGRLSQVHALLGNHDAAEDMARQFAKSHSDLNKMREEVLDLLLAIS